jgi:hypothetical protein
MYLKIVTICIFLVCCAAKESFAQREFRFGAKTGMAFTQNRNNNLNLKSFAVGINRHKVYNNNVFFEFGLGYQQFHQFTNNEETGYYRWEQNLGFNIPLALGYKLKEHLFSFDLNIFGLLRSQSYSYYKLRNTNFREDAIIWKYPIPIPIPLLSYQYKVNDNFYTKISAFHIPKKYKLNFTIVEIGINYTFDTKINEKKK